MSGNNITNKDNSNPQLTEFRISKLEEAVSSLSDMRECVLKWDAKFSANDSFLQCPIHKERMEQFEKRIDKLEVIVEDLDRFKWKAVGVLSIVILIVQIFGTTVVENLVKHPAAAASVSHTTKLQSTTNNVLISPVTTSVKPNK